VTAPSLPNLVVIGAMKCGTTALHGLLDAHPDIAMSAPKELNFFFGPDAVGDASMDAWHRGNWHRGNWHRGVEWYVGHFRPALVRGESSPGYTSPDHPEVAQRMADLLPDVRLVYLVRDPVRRAVSQYEHHRGEGTERRPLAEALLDPSSQYVARSRYFERLQPFLARFGEDSIAIVSQEQLLHDQDTVLRGLLEFLGLDAEWPPCPATGRAAPQAARAGRGSASEPLAGDLVGRFADAVRDDVEQLRKLAGRDFAEWSI
jgi:hypothetical protein